MVPSQPPLYSEAIGLAGSKLIEPTKMYVKYFSEYRASLAFVSRVCHSEIRTTKRLLSNAPSQLNLTPSERRLSISAAIFPRAVDHFHTNFLPFVEAY